MLYNYYGIMYVGVFLLCCFFFFKQKTAYEMRISDWSSDVCSSDLAVLRNVNGAVAAVIHACDPRDRRVVGDQQHLRDISVAAEIGRASCRERVCQYV